MVKNVRDVEIPIFIGMGTYNISYEIKMLKKQQCR